MIEGRLQTDKFEKKLKDLTFKFDERQKHVGKFLKKRAHVQAEAIKDRLALGEGCNGKWTGRAAIYSKPYLKYRLANGRLDYNVKKYD